MKRNQEILKTEQSLSDLLTLLKRDIAGLSSLPANKKVELLTALTNLTYKAEAEIAQAEIRAFDKVVNMLNLKYLVHDDDN